MHIDTDVYRDVIWWSPVDLESDAENLRPFTVVVRPGKFYIFIYLYICTYVCMRVYICIYRD